MPNPPRKNIRHRKKSYKKLFLFLPLLVLTLRPVLYWTPWHLPFTPHFTESYVLLAPGDGYTLKVNGLSAIASCKSSVPLVATVTQGGYVRARKCGKTVITATLRGKGNKTIRCLVQVSEPNKKSIRLCTGESAYLYLKGLRFRLGIKYKSANTKVAKISITGRITATGKGKTVITATYKGKKFECNVTVK